MGLSILGKRRLRWDLIHVHKYLMGESKEDGDRLFTVLPRDRLFSVVARDRARGDTN